jgi:NAD(P)-dependent dehydrogenase (short-subunit alcohol dehydrogenase family)
VLGSPLLIASWFTKGVNMKKLEGLRALITGGSSGIGQAIALAFAVEGADIAFTYLKNEGRAKQTAEKIENLGNKAFAIQANLADINDIQHAAQETVERLGGIDILVNNAGVITRHHDLFSIASTDLDYVYVVNLKAPFILTQKLAKQMQDQGVGGSIINISSMSAAIVAPGITHYECSKAALNALTRGTASSLAKYNIRVNAILPGLVETDINKEQREKSPELWKKRCEPIPLGRVGQPADIINLAILLASPKMSSWITGTIIPVDGGLSVTSPFVSK